MAITARKETLSSVVGLNIDWRLFLPGQVLMAVAMVAALRIYGEHDGFVAVAISASVLFALFATSVDEALSTERTATAGLFAVACSALAWLMPFPDRLPALLFAGWASLRVCLPRLPLARRLGAALWLVAVTALCQCVAAFAIQYAVLRARHWPVFSQLAAPVLGWLGLSAASVDGILYVNTSEQLLRITPNAEKLGFIYVGLFLAGLAPYLYLSNLRLGFYTRLAVATFAFLIWRYFALVCIYSQTQLIDCFWDAISNAALLSIFALGIYSLLPRTVERLELRAPVAAFGRKSACAATLIAGFCACLAWASAFDDPGRRKPGQVMIDESHSDWEWTHRSYDTTWYGDKAGYNYATLFEHLGKYYEMSRNEDRVIRPRMLADCDVLILKTPTRAYGADEIDAIVAFVRGGGGLYLIGDHTNVFGMTRYLNDVASRFGFEYGYDATYELSAGGLQQYSPPARLRDPTILHLPQRFLFGTSCTLRPAWTSRVSICGYGIRGLYLDYSRKGFFPEGHLESSMDFGWIAQGLSQKVGRGRVAAFTDSTIFSNFWYFIPGKNELFLGTVEWLNHRNSALGSLARWMPIVIMAAGFFLARGLTGALPSQVAFPTMVLGAGVGILAADYANAYSYSWPSAKQPITTVVFDRKYSDLNIPDYALPGGARSFHTFYTWVQRLGYVPKVSDDGFPQDGARILVMVYPRLVPSDADQRRLREWVEAGGTLVVIDGFGNQTPSVNDWLPAYGLRFDYSFRFVGDIQDTEGHRWATAPGIHVRGGEPVLFLRPPPMRPDAVDGKASDTPRPGTPTAAVARVGYGRVIAVGLADSFQDSIMGTTKTVPNEQQRDLYELEFALLTSITGEGKRLRF